MSEALIGLLGVIVGALMTAAKDIWVEWRSRQKNAEYLAIRVVSLLEQFIEGCAGVAGDDVGSRSRSGSATGVWDNSAWDNNTWGP